MDGAETGAVLVSGKLDPARYRRCAYKLGEEGGVAFLIMFDRVFRVKPWERMEGESEKAWKTFIAYRDLGVDRSVRALARSLSKSRQALYDWSKKYDWPARASAWDQKKDEARTTAITNGIAKAAEKMAYKQELSNERVLNEAANLAFSRVTDAVNWSGIDGLVDSDKLPDSVAAAVKSVDFYYDKQGNKHNRIEFHAKTTALDRLGQHKKLWGPKEDTAGSATNQMFLVLVQNFQTIRQDLKQPHDNWIRDKDEPDQ